MALKRTAYSQEMESGKKKDKQQFEPFEN